MMRRFLPILTLLLLLSPIQPKPCAADPSHSTDMRTVIFQGAVYLSGSATGVPNATVRLWCYAPPAIPSWQIRATGRTTGTGTFQLRDYFEGEPTSIQYRLEKLNPPGYSSHSAQAGSCNWPCQSAYASSANTIEYALYANMDYGFMSGSAFYISYRPPTLARVEPPGGRCYPGELQHFTLVAGDADGARDIRLLELEIDDACGYPYAHAVRLWLNPLAQRLYLAADDGLASYEAFLPDDGAWGQGTLSNSQCQIELAGCRFQRDGLELTLELALRFDSRFVGSHQLCASVTDRSNATSSEQVGIWLIEPLPTSTPSATTTSSPTHTPTASLTPTASVTYTPSTSSATFSPTCAPTASHTITASATSTPSPSATPTATPTNATIHLPLILLGG